MGITFVAINDFGGLIGFPQSKYRKYHFLPQSNFQQVHPYGSNLNCKLKDLMLMWIKGIMAWLIPSVANKLAPWCTHLLVCVLTFCVCFSSS